mgnify:CR=1 FL=1
MVTIDTYDNLADAHIAKGRLEAEGIPAELADAHLVQTDWLYSAAVGGIKLQVAEEDAGRARGILHRDHSATMADEGLEAEPGISPSTGGEADRRAALVHLAACAGALVPFGHLLGPLLVWLGNRGRFPEVEPHGKEALNFQLSVTVYAGIAAVLPPVSVGYPLLLALFTADLLLVLVAAFRTNRGLTFRYPLTIRILL